MPIDDFGQSRTIRAVRWAEVSDLLSSMTMSTYYGSHPDRISIRSLHDRVADDLKQWLRPVADLASFDHCYHINGIHAGIDTWLANERRPIFCLQGEYPYPRHVRDGITTVSSVDEIPSDAVVYLSNPFSATGCYDTRVEQIQNPIVLDMAYVGTTAANSINIRPNVERVFWSASKTFGVGNFRTGYVFMRQRDVVADQLRDAGYLNWLAIDLLSKLIGWRGVFDSHSAIKQRYLDLCERNRLNVSDSYLIAESNNPAHSHLTREDGTIRVPTGAVLDGLLYNREWNT